jgi:Protein of unknown function (DUF1365)
MYFLKPTEDLKGSETSKDFSVFLEDLSEHRTCSTRLEHLEPLGKPTRFSHSWAKGFHVSPFNSRKGIYSLVAYDPLYPHMTGRGPVNNTVTLKSSKGRSKIVARVFSEGAPVNPAAMSLWQKAAFLAAWWWVGLVTFPRIVREAGKLFFLRKLHIWYKPEPLRNSIGRRANTTELALESVFRSYLRYLVKSAESPFIVKYTAAGIRGDCDVVTLSNIIEGDLSIAEVLEFKVLTPIFYTRFVHFAHDLEAFFSEFNESSTIWLSNPSLLPRLVLRKPRPAQLVPSLTNYVCFKVIQKLRRRPPPMGGLKASYQSNVGRNKSDIRAFRPSAMDGYILTNGMPSDQKMYRTQVLMLFLSDRFAFGSLNFLSAEIFLLRCVILWLLAGCFAWLLL